MHPQLDRDSLVVNLSLIILSMVEFEGPRNILFCKIYTALNGGFLKRGDGCQPRSLSILHREYPVYFLPLIRKLHLEDFLELDAVHLTGRCHRAVHHLLLTQGPIVVSTALIGFL